MGDEHGRHWYDTAIASLQTNIATPAAMFGHRREANLAEHRHRRLVEEVVDRQRHKAMTSELGHRVVNPHDLLAIGAENANEIFGCFEHPRELFGTTSSVDVGGRVVEGQQRCARLIEGSGRHVEPTRLARVRYDAQPSPNTLATTHSVDKRISKFVASARVDSV